MCSGNEEWSFCARSGCDQCPLSSAAPNMGEAWAPSLRSRKTQALQPQGHGLSNQVWACK